jgi:hypothetical protein
MDPSPDYEFLVKQILLEYARLKPAYGDVESQVIFDDERGSYALMEVGWDDTAYVHGSVIHVDIVGDKIWIRYDGTEDRIANELIEAGVPKDKIVLGFRPEPLRAYTGFAIQ